MWFYRTWIFHIFSEDFIFLMFLNVMSHDYTSLSTAWPIYFSTHINYAGRWTRRGQKSLSFLGFRFRFPMELSPKDTMQCNYIFVGLRLFLFHLLLHFTFSSPYTTPFQNVWLIITLCVRYLYYALYGFLRQDSQLYCCLILGIQSWEYDGALYEFMVGWLSVP